MGYLSCKCEILLNVIGELFKGALYNYMLLLSLPNPLFTLDLFVVLFLRPESFVYLAADSLISISTYHLSLVNYAFQYVTGQTHGLFG